MRPIRVRSTKFDGSSHYDFDARVVSESTDCIRVYMSPGTPFDSYRGGGISKSHSLRMFWPDRYWNLFVRWRPDWSLEDYYVNIATPAKWDRHTITWVDLDLDLILSPTDREPLLDDADEFARHSVAWHYPPDLVSTCRATVDVVREMMRRQQPPFDGSIAAWRPVSLT